MKISLSQFVVLTTASAAAAAIYRIRPSYVLAAAAFIYVLCVGLLGLLPTVGGLTQIAWSAVSACAVVAAFLVYQLWPSFWAAVIAFGWVLGGGMLRDQRMTITDLLQHKKDRVPRGNDSKLAEMLRGKDARDLLIPTVWLLAIIVLFWIGMSAVFQLAT